jgi:hypothetical protein
MALTYRVGYVIVSVSRGSPPDTAAVKAAMERSGAKGEDYEQKVVQVVTGIAAARGDIAEGTGRTSGSDGGQVGDLIVTSTRRPPAAPKRRVRPGV